MCWIKFACQTKIRNFPLLYRSQLSLLWCDRLWEIKDQEQNAMYNFLTISKKIHVFFYIRCELWWHCYSRGYSSFNDSISFSLSNSSTHRNTSWLQTLKATFGLTLVYWLTPIKCRKHTHIHTKTYIYTCCDSYKFLHANTHEYTHKNSKIYILGRTYVHTYTKVHNCMNAHTHTHTHIYI